MTIKVVGVWPVNELGEIVAQAGAGTTTITGFVSQDQIPTDTSTNKVVIKLPDLDAIVLAEPITGFVSGAGTVGATDTILQAINKLDGNTALKANAANSALTGTTSTQAVVRNTRVVTAAGDITVSATDDIIVVKKTVGAATAVNLPAGVLGRALVVKDGKSDAGTNNITITPAAGNIDGATTFVMNVDKQAITIVYDGVQWEIF
jgi:hypothetical protein